MKANLKKLSSVALAAVLSVTMLAGCGNKAAAPKETLTIKLGSVVAASHPMNVALKNTFKAEVEKASKGTIKVEIYDGGVLGGEKELFDSVRNGNLQMAAIGTVMWNEVEKMSIPDWPFIFRDLDHAKKVYTGEIGKEMAADLKAKTGVNLLAFGPNGVRNFSSNKTITSLDSFKGMRLRMPNNPIHIKVGQLLGANVTPLPMGEVFTALEQKVVDGQDNPIATLRNEGWYEVQSAVYESNHMIVPLMLMGSDKMWQGLSEDQKKIISDAALKTQEESWKLYAESLTTDRKFLEENGLKFTTPDEATRAKLVEMMKPIYDDLYAKYPWAKDMAERIKNVK